MLTTLNPSSAWSRVGSQVYVNVTGAPGTKVTLRLVRVRIDPATGLPDDTGWHDYIVPPDGNLRVTLQWAGSNPGQSGWEIRADEPAQLGTRYSKWWKLP